MFKKPELYTESNSSQKQDIIDALNRFKKYFTWKEKECILDIGSGCGTITSESLLPLLPDSFECLVGADISKEMVLHSQKKNTHPKLSFVFFDIEESNNDKLLATFSDIGVDHGFDKIFSFYCLHWVKNLRQAIKNISALTKPGGHCFVLFVEYGRLYDVWKAMSLSERWKPYLKNVEDLEKRYPNCYNKNVKEEYFSLLKEFGFQIIESVSIPAEKPVDPSSMHFLRGLEAIDPLIQYIPKDLHKSYIDDSVQILMTLSLENVGKVIHDYKLLATFFFKPTT